MPITKGALDSKLSLDLERLRVVLQHPLLEATIQRWGLMSGRFAIVRCPTAFLFLGLFCQSDLSSVGGFNVASFFFFGNEY